MIRRHLNLSKDDDERDHEAEGAQKPAWLQCSVQEARHQPYSARVAMYGPLERLPDVLPVTTTESPT
jgi:hypothetical protein